MSPLKRPLQVTTHTLAPRYLKIARTCELTAQPMYVGMLTVANGEVLPFENRSVAIYVATAWLGFHLFVCLYEEPTLTRRYGEKYLAYKHRVPRWLPRLASWRGDPTKPRNLSA